MSNSKTNMDLEELVTEIKERLDIVQIVGRYVELRQVGGRYVAPCPFHQETKPSFNVNPEKGFFYCFGCQAAGDVISFYQRINGLEFKEALKDLAEEAGIKFYLGKGNSSSRKTFFELYELATDFFKNQLQSSNGAKAREYLASRQVSELVQKTFLLGYSPADWHGLEKYFQSKGIDINLAVQSGLLVKNDKGQVYDRFRDRLMFPIRDLQGRTIAFGGRVLGEGDPKYLNSNESLIYKKGEHLYGLYEAKSHILKEKEAILSEGYLDVLALVQAGFKNSCAILGTSLTREQVLKLAQLASKVILLLDGDAAGKKAAWRSAEMLLAEGINCAVALLPEGEDPDSFLKKYGPEQLQRILEQSQEGLAYCLKMVRENKSPREQVGWIEDFLKRVRDLKLKGFYLSAIAIGLNISEKELRASLENVEGQLKIETREIKKSFTAWDKEVLLIGIIFPQEARKLAEEGVEHFFQTKEAKNFWQKLISKVDVREFSEEESNFYFQSKLKEDFFQGKKEELLKDLRFKMLSKDKKLRKQNLFLALARAQKRGDLAETKRILGLLQKEFAEQEV
ncbi:MAG: DNA primase [Desulfonauticus sp. 38_4375]|nr:MAG: DNA primase [Desulfonauticus sp. 38_4375]